MIRRALAVLCLLLLTSPFAHAAHESIHGYAAVGINYSFSSFRLGSGDWELGLLNQAIGFDKVFDFGSNYYTSFGLVYTGGVGLYGGVGFTYRLWFLPIRGELSGYMDSRASSYASGLLGVTYGF